MWNVSFVSRMAEIDRSVWNGIAGRDCPFMRHEFLNALENSGAVSARTGWQSSHVLVSRDGKVVAVMPLYEKAHSYGEYVFDQAWAEAWHRCGREYYPKLLSAIPFTPVSGPRLCIDPEENPEPVVAELLAALKARLDDLSASSWHLLFPQGALADSMAAHGVMMRQGVQFHWFNRSYQSFDDFLALLSSRKRKSIRKERASVADQGVRLETVCGTDITEALWDQFFTFYQMTYAKRSGHGGYLNRAFFAEIAATMPEQLVLVLARASGRTVAGALSFRSATCLYGRYWGCVEAFSKLHFEACYYQGIEYCIEHQLARFDSGAQGEHKIQRGFEPVITYSNHWVRDPAFRPAVAEFLERERDHADAYRRRAEQLLPFKSKLTL